MKSQKEINNHYWQGEWEKQRDVSEQLLSCLKLAYRKHHLDDQKIGWDELSDKMRDTLCNAMGDKEFIKFLSENETKESSERARQMWKRRFTVGRCF
jgi:hypothetical protein